MSTITAVLEPHSDGTVHLPVPVEMRTGRVRVTATFAPEGSQEGLVVPVSPEKLQERSAALAQILKLDPYREIADPAAWQKEVRKDRLLPGRD